MVLSHCLLALLAATAVAQDGNPMDCIAMATTTCNKDANCKAFGLFHGQVQFHGCHEYTQNSDWHIYEKQTNGSYVALSGVNVVEEKCSVHPAVGSQACPGFPSLIEYVHFPAPGGYCSQLPAAWVTRTGWATPKEAYDREECSTCQVSVPADKQWLPGTCASVGKDFESGWSTPTSKDPALGCSQWCRSPAAGGTGVGGGGGTEMMV